MSKISGPVNKSWYRLIFFVYQDPRVNLAAKLTYTLLWLLSKQLRQVDIDTLRALRRVSRRQIFWDLNNLEKTAYIKRTHTTIELLDIIGEIPLAEGYVDLDSLQLTEVVDQSKQHLGKEGCAYCQGKGFFYKDIGGSLLQKRICNCIK